MLQSFLLLVLGAAGVEAVLLELVEAEAAGLLSPVLLLSPDDAEALESDDDEEFSLLPLLCVSGRVFDPAAPPFP